MNIMIIIDIALICFALSGIFHIDTIMDELKHECGNMINIDNNIYFISGVTNGLILGFAIANLIYNIY